MAQSETKRIPDSVFFNYYYNYTIPIDEQLRRHRVYYVHPLPPANRQVRRVQQQLDWQNKLKLARKADQERANFSRELREWKNSFADRCPNYYAKI